MKSVRSCQNFVTVSWFSFENVGGKDYRLHDYFRDFIVRSPRDFMNVMEFVRDLRENCDVSRVVVSDGKRSFSI